MSRTKRAMQTATKARTHEVYKRRQRSDILKEYDISL